MEDKTNNNTEIFLNNVNSELKTLSSWVIKRSNVTGQTMDYIVNLPKSELENVIISMKPSNLKMITNYIYIFNLYARYFHYYNAINTLKSIDRKEVWNTYKETESFEKRFISFGEFKDWIFNVETFEEFNADYYSALLRCLYYGIYCDDMSVIKNLHGEDIDTNTGKIHLKEDSGKEYDVTVPISLADDLMELSETDIWERRNKSGIIQMKIEGAYHDTCFKIENRGGRKVETNYRYAYFNKIRKISKEYLDFNIKPFNLYISGIMEKIKTHLEKDGYSLEYAFVDHKRSASNYINEELEKSHYTNDTKYFRQIVSCHLDDFKD